MGVTHSHPVTMHSSVQTQATSNLSESLFASNTVLASLYAGGACLPAMRHVHRVLDDDRITVLPGALFASLGELRAM